VTTTRRSGVSMDSGRLDKYPSRALPPLSLPRLPPPLPLSHPSSPCHPPLPLLSLPLITARDLGERCSSPAGAGGSRPPNAFLCNSQPKICESVKSFTHWFTCHLNNTINLRYLTQRITSCYTRKMVIVSRLCDVTSLYVSTGCSETRTVSARLGLNTRAVHTGEL